MFIDLNTNKTPMISKGIDKNAPGKMPRIFLNPWIIWSNICKQNGEHNTYPVCLNTSALALSPSRKIILLKIANDTSKGKGSKNL